MRIFVESSDIIVVLEFRRKYFVDGLVVRIGFGSDVADRLIEQNQCRIFLRFFDGFVDSEIRRFDVQFITCYNFLRVRADCFPVYGNISLAHE